MNPAAILALIGNLYEQVGELQAENIRLRAAAHEPPEDQP